MRRRRNVTPSPGIEHFQARGGLREGTVAITPAPPLPLHQTRRFAADCIPMALPRPHEKVPPQDQDRNTGGD
ncbi:hypothetical protein chiPu_0022990 [Chiloscyllium punctatum]|uniref:Uncharacterized protein n=1 Tax=Chiloscyllium punctatum TaxID=137246 RepID=A0A401T8E5_CHIPU|nr:hypothetical protein [Chiloscyllium punctatum]